MNKLYSELRSKIEKLQATNPSFFKINFYKALLGILEYAIILTKRSADAFPLIFQAQGRQIVDQSYRDFKSYQRKVRLIFWLLAILILMALKVY